MTKAFMLNEDVFLLMQEHFILIGTWRTTQENSTTTVSYGSDLSRLIRRGNVLAALSERSRGGSELQGHSPVLLG